MILEFEKHTPVLLNEVLLAFEPLGAGTYIDATLGYGGHTFAILERIAGSRVIGIDADEGALAFVREEAVKRGIGSDRLQCVHGNFRAIGSLVPEQGRQNIRGVLFDFGFSSGAMDDASRGLSFQTEGPLDMRFDRTEGTMTAADVVNNWSEQELADTILHLGEDRYARKIAAVIVRARLLKPFATTIELADVIEKAIGRRGRIHPATRTFQAIRIAVNDELKAIGDAMPAARDLLQPGGRIVTIAFHSLEDRIVKVFAKQEEEKGTMKRLQRRVMRPTEEEVEQNRRSRSAKMRIIEKK